MIAELPVEKLRWSCNPQGLGCDTSQETKPLTAIIGQERAVRALQFGLGIKEMGFNIYVAGPSGTGRTTAVKRFLEATAKEKPAPPDWCYVANFQDNYHPKTLSFPPGLAREFHKEMKDLIEGIQQHLQKAFESEEYAKKGEETVKELRTQKEELFKKIHEKAAQEGFSIQTTPIGMVIIPLKDGKTLIGEEFRALTPEEKEEISKKQGELQEELKAASRQARWFDKSSIEKLHQLDRKVAEYILDPAIEDFKEKYLNLPEVINHLEEVRNNIYENLSLFRTKPQAQAVSPFPPVDQKEKLLKQYAVNILVDNAKLKGVPVVIELNPTYNNLFGRIEKEAQFGALVTDFTMIREGSLHRANGGYLVLQAEDVLRNLFSWDSLKRALRNKKIIIEEAGERLGFLTTKTLRPEPIHLDIKVVLIGTSWLYHLLYISDEDFRELFKVKSDFDVVMDRTEENIQAYTSFACMICEEEKLKHLDSSALAKLVEYGCRLASDQEKLSTRFSDISDVIRETNYYAVQEDSSYINQAHVKKAIEEKFYRSNLLQEKIEEMIGRGTLMIDITGEKVGQVNGLSIINLGDIIFCRPNRITASIGLGREGLIDIEREAKLGGPIHSKGVMILSGFLAEKYARDKLLSLSARLVFEQSYSEVEGDSASSTELYAILSSLSGVPIKQGISVTGSINQKGEVQVIGGVNEKIEGFFEVCKMKGLTGEQGVIIPDTNTTNLMLKEEVVEAAKDGKFHIWPVRHIDEGIEILTGMKAGERSGDGTFDEGTINYLVDHQLRKMADALKEFGKSEG
jgi:lon-related putative ATP-dependent protease